jgi:hypothetical protein
MLENGLGWMPALSPEQFDEMMEKGKKLYLETKEKFSQNPDYLWVAGYIINFCGYYFIEETNFTEIGFKMMKDAYSLCPNNQLFKLSIIRSELQIEDKINNIEYLQLCENSNNSTKYFENRGCMGEYFQMIFNCEDELKRLEEIANKKD